MSSVGPAGGMDASMTVEMRTAARDGVREVVAAGGASGRSGRRWVVPLAAASAVAAAACAPVAWPLLAGGALATPAALAAAFGQVGAAGGGLLSRGGDPGLGPAAGSLRARMSGRVSCGRH